MFLYYHSYYCCCYVCQIRIFRCLFLLTDVATVEHISARGGWTDVFTNLLYSSELHRLRMFSSSSRGPSLEIVDKSGLVRSLCRCRDDSAGRVAACLAVDFQLSNPQLWTAIIRRLSAAASDLEVLLRPLPCRRSWEITEATYGLVTSWLNRDTVDHDGALRICALLQQGPAYIDPEVVLRCVKEFAHHSLPLCAVSCALMLPRDLSVVQLVDAVLAAGCSVDPEVAALVRSGRVLPAARRIQVLFNRN